jgi:hypothetical protein
MLRRGIGALLVGSGLLAIQGCATTQSVTERTPRAPLSRSVSRGASRGAERKVSLNNPAQPADPEAETLCSEVAVGHACRATTAVPSDPNQSRQRNCDTNIVANAATSCGLAENTFYEYYRSGSDSGSEWVMAHSPETGRDYELFCDRRDGLVACTGSPLSTGIYTSFPQLAVSEYTAVQASAYARSRDVGNPAVPYGRKANESSSDEAPESEQAPSQAEDEPSEDSRGESECTNGTYINSSGNTVCKPEESSSGVPAGATAECEDGTFSFSEHHSGTCSYHGGVKRWL